VRPTESAPPTAPWSSTVWDTFESHAGKRVSIVHFGQPFPSGAAFEPTPFDLTTDRGAIPLVTYMLDDLTGLRDGAYDEQITTWAIGVRAWGKPFWLRFDHEMNGTWYGYGRQARTDPQLFVDAWRHLHDVVAEAGANNVTWTFCPNAVFPGSTPLSSLYPCDSYVDWTCMDGYNFGTNPRKPAGWRGFYTTFKATYDQLLELAPTKPIIIAETASTEFGRSKAGWITDALGTQLPLNFPKVRAVTWFGWDINEDGGRWDWSIESSASAEAAFANAIAADYFKPNDYASLPRDSKVPVPEAAAGTGSP
jgi:mannan endo-1,4-beta-mannosidase